MNLVLSGRIRAGTDGDNVHLLGEGDLELASAEEAELEVEC